MNNNIFIFQIFSKDNASLNLEILYLCIYAVFIRSMLAFVRICCVFQANLFIAVFMPWFAGQFLYMYVSASISRPIYVFLHNSWNFNICIFARPM